MTRYLLVAAGGALGSVARYALSGWVQTRLAPAALFPWGTAAVNLAGCGAIGFLGTLAERQGALGAEARTFLVVGLLGGFTTFSAFGYETFQLLRDDRLAAALGNVALQVVAGVLAVWFGAAAARALS